jgi:hypothetical protein
MIIAAVRRRDHLRHCFAHLRAIAAERHLPAVGQSRDRVGLRQQGLQAYDKRKVAKQHIRVHADQPVAYRAPKAPPPPPANNQETVVRDQTIWGQI